MQTSGRVVSVEVKNGQRVHKGQALVSVDNTQALNSLQGAEATLKHAQDGYDRAHQVHEKGVIADQKMVEIESQLNQAQSLYAAAKQRLEECTLVAPCDGIVDGLEVEKGQTIIPGTKVCTIKDVSAFCVLFTVPEGEVSAFRNTSSAMKGEVECAAVNRVFPITVTETSVTANAVTHTYDVKARIEGGTDVLMIGMVAKVQITNHQSSITNNTIVIPARCVLLKPEGHTVWVMENGQAVRKDIRVDGYQADGVRVSEGLQEGDTLIIDGYQKLYTGCKVVES
jgi:RND family efflux transporter MFP subunit